MIAAIGKYMVTADQVKLAQESSYPALIIGKDMQEIILAGGQVDA